MDEESILDANNVTADTFSHASNARRDRANVVFTSENLDKSDDMADAVNDLIINNAGYCSSNTANARDSQGDLTRNLETVTHTSNSK